MLNFMKNSKVPLIILLIFSTIIILISIFFYRIPETKLTGIYNSRTFWEGFFLNLNTSIIDIFIFSILLVYLVNRSSNKARRETEINIHKEWLEINRNQDGQQVVMMNVLTLKKLLNLNSTDLNLSKIFFNNINLVNIKVENSKFMGAKFSGSMVKECIFEKCDFKGAVFEKATLKNVKFIESSLRNCWFQDAVAKGLILRECDLYKADFTGGNFKNADLRNVDLLQATFNDANFSHANFIGAKNLNLDNLAKARLLNKIKIDGESYEYLKTNYSEKFTGNE